ncbi:MAG: anthranilate synthase component I family protein, partial [Aureibaculum sp.]
MTFKLNTHYKKIIADTITPVSVYLKIRDKYPNSILLESSDYHANDNSFSYICCNPIASIEIINEKIIQTFPDGNTIVNAIDKETNIPQVLDNFAKLFEVKQDTSFKFINNGLFGYIGYDAVRYFEDIKIAKKEGDLNIPDIYYAVYQNIIAINHFKNDAYIFAHCYNAENNIDDIHH